MSTVVSAPQKTLNDQLNWLACLAITIIGFASLYLAHGSKQIAVWDVFALISLGVVGTWRWSLFILRGIRSRIYLSWVFPRWRRRANALTAEQLPPVCLLVPTYKEKTWITERVFRAIAQEARTLAQPITLLVNSSSDEENDFIRQVLEAEDPGLRSMHLIQMVQKDGKRKAMADGLKELVRHGLPSETIIALMDGDSELSPGTLRQCLPFFRLFPRLGALTTDELPVVQGSYLFAEWFQMRFAQRHQQMCSDSLSRKVMCLTGRFSLFRAEAALHPSFSDQLENDNLDDWLWGRFKFLSGDDKSTWFWLLRRGYDMLYIPDALVYSIETVSGSVIDRAYENMRRWYGNMLRNNSRAIALGPKVTGFYLWYGLLDQRISIWTSLISPSCLILSMVRGHFIAASIIASWILFSRSLMLLLVFQGRPSSPKPIHLPILLATQWSSSLVKIWTQMNLAKQKWANRGNQSISADGTGRSRVAKLGISRFLLASQVFSFAIFLLWLNGVINPLWDLEGLHLKHSASQQVAVQQVEAINHGIMPNDGKDDAAALQALIARQPLDKPVQINLPIGELDLFKPISIDRSNIRLKGQGISRTILLAQFDPTADTAILTISTPKAGQTVALAVAQTAAKVEQKPVQNVQISGFTLRHSSSGSDGVKAINSLVLDNVAQATLSNLHLERGIRYPVVLKRSRDVIMQYVTAEDGVDRSKIVMNDANVQPDLRADRVQ
ncbi:glycosyltransferase family 2 protein [Phormidium sp. FACHB-592]|uniref:Glycosyltransferase family 2 protein n=1 Tax=Stenomitos frigidus AS-A4 TaxID=2933935 RepID=A0ABV0KH55_9CYAN|nr:glycosyltransferase [Phormidium sp. FACHB-592]MBD2078186.1 glycosyltransferase family 2 protein [Phormidium sp. FACHB-592]